MREEFKHNPENSKVIQGDLTNTLLGGKSKLPTAAYPRLINLKIITII